MPAPYPTTFMDEAKTLATIIRGGDLATRKAEAAHCAWHVQGYLQGQAIPDNRPVFGSVPVENETLFDLAEACADYHEFPTYGSSVVDWHDVLKTLLTILPLLIG